MDSKESTFWALRNMVSDSKGEDWNGVSIPRLKAYARSNDWDIPNVEEDLESLKFEGKVDFRVFKGKSKLWFPVVVDY